MAKTAQTPQQQEKRLQAYEMYAKGVLDSGQRASLRGIAQQLGVTQTTVRYWRDKDRWEERVDAALQHKTIEATKDNVAVENLMRSGFYRAVRRLQTIIEDKVTKPTTTVRAVLAYGRLCKDFNVIRPSDLKETPDNSIGLFQDDLPRGPDALPATDGRRGDEEADGGTPIPISDALPESSSSGVGLGGGKSVDRPESLLERSGLPGRPDEWESNSAIEEAAREWNGYRLVRTEDPTNDTVLLDPDDDEIITARCPGCGRFWDGLQCESCRLGVNSRDAVPHDPKEED